MIIESNENIHTHIHLLANINSSVIHVVPNGNISSPSTVNGSVDCSASMQWNAIQKLFTKKQHRLKNIRSKLRVTKTEMWWGDKFGAWD